MEKQFHELHREIWSVLKDEVMKGYAQSTQAAGGELMSRLTLLIWQVLVAVVALSLWQFFATVPVFGRMILPPFFFSQPGRCRQPDRQMVRDRA